MAKKVKPYEDGNRNRTLPNQSSNKKNNNNKNNQNKEKKKSLDNTTKIRIEPERLRDEKSLDTSFLEGRLQEKGNKKERDKILKEKQAKARSLDLLKSLFFLLSFFCVILLIILILWNQSHMQESTVTPEEDIEEEVEYVIDDNYLFIGDSHVLNLPLKDFKYPYVVVAGEGMTTGDILGDLHQKVYIYNPSVILFQVGFTDLVREVRIEDIKENYSNIIKEIQENRPNAHIYIESVYPINFDKIEDNSKYHNINNATIKSLNKELKDLANTYHCTYVDLYSKLSDNNYLKENYSDDGILLNEEGYKVVLKSIKEITETEKLEQK